MVFLDADKFDWMHMLEVLFGGMGALAIFAVAAWGWHREDKKDREEKLEETKKELLTAADKVEVKNEVRHRENRDDISKITNSMNVMTYKLDQFPPHSHGEESGVLTVEGMWPKRR
jgi:hypothetical protein